MAKSARRYQDQLALDGTDPASAVAEFEQLLLSNSGEDAFDMAIKLLSAKLLDELEVERGGSPRFRVLESAEATFRSVESVYRRALKKWPNLNGSATELGIPPPQLVRCMRPLIGWDLLGSDYSVLDAVLERLVAKDAKGALGQYFTPREVVKLCVSVLNPGPGDLVVDPACGSGGFLFEAISHSMRNKGRAPKCLGIDFGAKAIKVATLLAAASHGAAITISKANSIDGREYFRNTPTEWESFLGKDGCCSTKRAESWGAWNRLRCSVLLTNPPFAGDIDEIDVLDAYETHQESLSRKAVGREHLFLERAVHLLRPGGRLGIVLPQGLLANASSSYIRTWLLRKCRVLGVVGLHQFAFLPFTSVKTALLFLEKPRSGDLLPSDYNMFFAVSKNPGKDSSGRTLGSTDYEAIAAAFSMFLGREGFPWASTYDKSKQDVSAEIARLGDVLQSDRLDAEYYDPRARSLLRELADNTSSRIGNVVGQKIERFKKPLFREIAYYDISSIDSKTGLGSPTPVPASSAPSRASYLLEPGDVLVSTVRPDRNLVGIVTERSPIAAVGSNGFCVLRPEKVESEVLFAYCKTEAFKNMLARNATASMYPTVTDKDVLHVPFRSPPDELRNQLIALVRRGLEGVRSGQRQLEEAIRLMNRFIEGSDGHDGKSSTTPKIQEPKGRYDVRRKRSKGTGERADWRRKSLSP